MSNALRKLIDDEIEDTKRKINLAEEERLEKQWRESGYDLSKFPAITDRIAAPSVVVVKPSDILIFSQTTMERVSCNPFILTNKQTILEEPKKNTMLIRINFDERTVEVLNNGN